eukprot:jgi/Tetstr1/426909/TSEL_017122.t1
MSSIAISSPAARAAGCIAATASRRAAPATSAAAWFPMMPALRAPLARLAPAGSMLTSARPHGGSCTCTAGRGRLTCAAAAAATDDATADMNTMQPLGDRLLVVPQDKEPVTAGGVILPTEVVMRDDEEAVLGVVAALGEGVDIAVEIGQTVLYNKQQITEVPLGTSSVVFVAQGSIAAVLS